MGQFVVDHVRDVVHVDAAGGDVGGHEHGRPGRLEGGERLLPLGLRLVAVDGGRVDAGLLEVAVELVGAVLRPCEHDHAARGLIAQEPQQERLLFALRHEEHRLGHRLRGRRSRGGSHFEWIAKHRIGKVTNLAGKRGGEEERLPVARQLAHDLPNVMDEAHVEHPISLVEHEELD